MNFLTSRSLMTESKCEKIIHKILSNCPYQISISQLDEEFEEETGMHIPYEYYGYTKLKAYIKSLKMLVVSHYDCVKLADNTNSDTRKDDHQFRDYRVHRLTERNLYYFRKCPCENCCDPPENAKIFAWLSEVNMSNLNNSRRTNMFKGAIKSIKRIVRVDSDD